ncbi:polysaccharide deacetylase family protein [Arthrobacter sp. NPDC080031]|uniref:polysaccharide deacetylase family protein n=1 Tax=Arthrobacter sp. NPDC080031 TaxID=3155918 RepID=UPI00344C5771
MSRRSLLAGIGVAAAAATGVGAIHALSSEQVQQPTKPASVLPVIREPNELPRTVLAQFQRDHGFRGDGTAAGAVDDTGDYVEGAQSVYFETTGNGVQASISKPSALSVGFDMSGKVFAVLLKVTGGEHLTRLSLRAGDSAFKNYFQFMIQASPTLPFQEIFPENRWSWVTMPWIPGSEGKPARENLTDLCITAADDGTGNRVKIQIQAIAVQNERPEAFPSGVISISFDDCWGSQRKYGTSFLEKYGFQPTIYTIVDEVGRPGRLSLPDLHQIEASGGEIAAHAWTTASHNLGFTRLPADVLDSELRMTRNWLLENGFRGADLFAYPLGYFNADVIKATSKYFKFARTLNNRQEETLPPGEMYTCRAQSSTNTVTLAHLRDRIDACKANGTWLNLVFHDITPGVPAASVQIALSTFQQAIDYVARMGIPVRTTSEVLRRAM